MANQHLLMAITLLSRTSFVSAFAKHATIAFTATTTTQGCNYLLRTSTQTADYNYKHPNNRQIAGTSTRLRYFSSEEQFKLYPPATHLQGDVISCNQKQRIVSFGDVHGDMAALQKFLAAAKVIDDKLNWCGEDTLLVQCGDILDRGDQELACFYLLCKLSKQAAEAGGGVVILYGNHEALNSVGLFQYAFPGGNVEFENVIGKNIDKYVGNNRWRIQFANNQPSRWAAFEPGGLLAESMLKNMKASIVVGRTCFVHAGMTAKHVKDFGGVAGMNRAAEEWITKVHHGENNLSGEFGSVEEVLDFANKRAKAASDSMPACLGGGIGSPSPVWMRDYSQPADGVPKNPKAQMMIDAALKALGDDVQRMVMGHTPQRHINAALKGKAWRVDVGASAGVANGMPEALEIIHGGDDDGEDVVSVLTLKGGRIPSSERQVLDTNMI